jgi:hypothetical protein
MQISMYQASVPAFIRALNNLAAILEKAQAHAQARKIDASALLTARLFPDMFPLVRQVQIATDTATGGAARLADVAVPVFENHEASFPELVARLHEGVAFLETLRAEQIDGTEAKTVTWQTRSSTKSMLGLAYLMSHVLPNVHFHVTTAYNILRHNGLEIGKQDYLGRS